MIKCNIENNEIVVKFPTNDSKCLLGILLKKYLDRSDCPPIFSNPNFKIDLRNLLLVKCKSMPEIVSSRCGTAA